MTEQEQGKKKLLRALITKPLDNESPKFSTQYEFDSCAKTTPQADVPGAKSWGLGSNTVLWRPF